MTSKISDMPDKPQTVIDNRLSKDARQRHTAKRFASERRFKFLGLASVLTAAGFLLLLLSTVVGNGIPAFTFHKLTLPIDLSPSIIQPENVETANYRGMINNGLKETLPFVSGRSKTRASRRLISSGSAVLLRQQVLDNPDILGGKRELEIPLSDTADLYLKGAYGQLQYLQSGSNLSLEGTDDTVILVADTAIFKPFVDEIKSGLQDSANRVLAEKDALNQSLATQMAKKQRLEGELESASTQDDEAQTTPSNQLRATIAAIADLKSKIDALSSRAEALQKRSTATSGMEVLNSQVPSLFVQANGGTIKITKAGNEKAEGEFIIPMKTDGKVTAGEWKMASISVPESQRKFSDREIVWLESLREAKRVKNGLNTVFFTRGASREAEMAGIWGAVVGSFLTLIVTLFLSFPVAVAAAVYLEEFAPKNRFTQLIEVNINNLAAVPSIVFGLLGLAVFLNFANLPRSAPLVGGMVLALMTLPTIIIASRAALKAVPPSIREAALGVGASRVQAVFHHVLPLALPGMLTGTIIGMAQALGETAPLLMIGMVAFIVDIPGGFTDPATVLPVQIYMWADFPEAAFQHKTAAAIMILLGFLILMNAIAVVLRKRFERRW